VGTRRKIIALVVLKCPEILVKGRLVMEIHRCDDYEYDDFVVGVDEQSLLYV